MGGMHRARQPDQEVGHRVAGDLAVEREAAAGVVRRLPARLQPPQIEPGADVMRAPVVGDDVRELERRVELQPVRAAAPMPVKPRDGEARDARIVEPHVAVEAGDAEDGAGVARPFTWNKFSVSSSSWW